MCKPITFEQAVDAAKRWKDLPQSKRESIINQQSKKLWGGAYKTNIAYWPDETNVLAEVVFHWSGETAIKFPNLTYEVGIKIIEMSDGHSPLEPGWCINIEQFAELATMCRRYDPFTQYIDRWQDEQYAIKRNLESTDRFKQILAPFFDVESIPDSCINVEKTEEALRDWLHGHNINIYL